MPIYHDYKVIYIHIPKTGGTYVHRKIFNGVYDNPNYMESRLISPDSQYDWNQHLALAFEDTEIGNLQTLSHLTYNELKLLRPRELKNYRIITFVRNPFARLVSEFVFNAKGLYGTNFNEFVKNIDVYLNNPQTRRHLIPQSDYLVDQMGKIPQKIMVFKLEGVSVASDIIRKMLHLPRLTKEEKTTKINQSVSDSDDYRNYYDEESIKTVQEFYKSDFQNFEYSTDLWG